MANKNTHNVTSFSLLGPYLSLQAFQVSSEGKVLLIISPYSKVNLCLPSMSMKHLYLSYKYWLEPGFSLEVTSHADHSLSSSILSSLSSLHLRLCHMASSLLCGKFSKLLTCIATCLLSQYWQVHS